MWNSISLPGHAIIYNLFTVIVYNSTLYVDREQRGFSSSLKHDHNKSESLSRECR